MIALSWLPGTADIGEALAIRMAVFVDEQGFSPDIERDEHDASAWHVLLRVDGVVCGTGRIFAEAFGVLRVGRICVSKEYRGRGLGDLIMRALIDRALRLNAQEVRLGSQETVRAFYEKLGFAVCGEGYLEEHCPHVPMAITRQAMEKLLDCANCKGCARANA